MPYKLNPLKKYFSIIRLEVTMEILDNAYRRSNAIQLTLIRGHWFLIWYSVNTLI